MATQQGKKTENAPGSVLGLDDTPELTEHSPMDNRRTSAANPAKPVSQTKPVSNTPSVGQPINEKVSETASGIMDKAKETASGTYDAVASKATTKIEAGKGELSTGLKTLADTFRRTGTDLKATPQSTPLTDLTAKYTGSAADQIEKVANYFERKNLRAMMRDSEDFARRNPAIFLGAAFGIGLLAARFLKSSPPSARNSDRSMSSGIPTALPPSGDRPNPVPSNP
jgi:hypothetical protein